MHFCELFEGLHIHNLILHQNKHYNSTSHDLLKDIYVKGKVTKRVFHLLNPSSNVHNSQGWTRKEARHLEHLEVSHVGAATQVLQPTSTAFPHA